MSALAPRTTLEGSQVRALAVAAAAVLAGVAVYSPKYAVAAVVLGAVVALVFWRLPAGVVAFTILTFPEHLPGSIGAGATVAKPLGLVLAASWGALVIAKRGALRLLPRDHPAISWTVIAFVGLAAISSVWATDLGQVQYQLPRLVQVAILLYVVYTAATTPRTFRAIVWAYLAGSVITATYSIASGSYLSSGRLAGLFDPNIFAAEVLPAIGVSSFLLLTPRRLRTRVLAALVLAVDVVALALTQSRGGFVGLAVALIAAVVLAGRARPRIAVGVVLVVALGVGYYAEYAPAQVKARFSTISAQNTSGRSDEWRIAARMFEDHPVLGVGLGNYPSVEPRYATRSLNLQFVRFVVQLRLVAHNTYLEVAAELGAAGLATLLALLGFTLVPATRALARFEATGDDLEFYARGLVVGAVGMLTAYTFMSAQYEKQLWLILGLLAAIPTLASTSPASPDRSGELMDEPSSPRCSVVIAAHNSASTVAATIASVRLQTLEDWELVVVDDGSSDRTAEIVEAIRDARIRLVRQPNRGPSAARNAGLRLARGRLVSTLDSDDLWMPDYLENMAGLLDRNPDAGVAYTDAWALDDATGRIRKTSAMRYQRPPVPPPTSPAAFLAALLASNFVYNSVTMRREVVEAVGGYDERFWAAEDWELWLRIASKGFRFVRADDLLAIYRHREGSLHTQHEPMFAANCRVYQLLENEWDVPAEIKEQARSLASAYRRKASGVSGFPGGDPFALARIVKRAVERRTLWYGSPPREVAVVLDAIDALVARDAA